MYFAKLVHSQTRRCIQNSVAPVVSMTNATSALRLPQTATPNTQQPLIEGYNHPSTANTSMMSSYHRYDPASNFEKAPHSIPQYFNMSSETTIEMPTLENLSRQNKNEEIDLRNEPRYEVNGNNYNILPYEKYDTNDMDFNNSTNMNYNPTGKITSVSHLLPVDKESSDFKDSEKLTTTTSSSFEKIPNVEMMLEMQINHNTETSGNTTDSLGKNNKMQNNTNNKEINNLYPIKTQSSSKTITNSINNKNQTKNNIEDSTTNRIQVQDKIKSESFKTPSSVSSKIDEINPTYEISQSSVVSTNNLKSEKRELVKLPNVPVNENIESNSSIIPVSIENIENAIYGELLSPLEVEKEQSQETVSVVPALLENLVTQPDTLDSQKNYNLKEDREININTSPTNNIIETEKELENNSNNQDTNQQQNEPLVNNEADYGAYENVDTNATADTQQEQSYDYSNYDPTQYSYPGYIYDEATGEYKPDPNAPPEQYAPDQQYATDGYDPQYQQQNGYDYNQSYAQESSSNIDNNADYNNYKTEQVENDSNISTVDSNLDQQHLQQLQYPDTEPQLRNQLLEEAIENFSDEQPQLPAKVPKPTSILSTTEKNEAQKKKKRVNFVDSSEADESGTDKEVVLKSKPTTGGSSESDFDFSSSVEGEVKTT